VLKAQFSVRPDVPVSESVAEVYLARDAVLMTPFRSHERPIWQVASTRKDPYKACAAAVSLRMPFHVVRCLKKTDLGARVDKSRSAK
jgi:hypothetical protein